MHFGGTLGVETTRWDCAGSPATCMVKNFEQGKLQHVVMTREWEKFEDVHEM